MKTGRRPLDQSGEQSVIVPIRFPPKLLLKVKAQAKKRKKSLSEYVRSLLEGSLENNHA